MAYAAFDYDRQRWVTGERARVMLVAQLSETLGVLESPRGADYLAFTRKAGDPAQTVAEAVAAIRAQLTELSK